MWWIMIHKEENRLYTVEEVEEFMIKAVMVLNNITSIREQDIRLSAYNHPDDFGILVRCSCKGLSQAQEVLINEHI